MNQINQQNILISACLPDVTMAGIGITAALLKKNDIRVFNQHQIDDLSKHLKKQF